jgi:hypothetical protein
VEHIYGSMWAGDPSVAGWVGLARRCLAVQKERSRKIT